VQDTELKFKKVSEQLLEITRDQAEAEIATTIGVIIFRCSKVLDQLCISCLVVAGAVLTLCISNAKDVLSIISPSGYTWMMILFLLSVLIGFFAKIVFAIIDFYLFIHCETSKAYRDISDKFEQETKDTHESAMEIGISLEKFYPRDKKIKEKLVKTFPKRWHSFLSRHSNNDDSDSGAATLLVNAWEYVEFQFYGFIAQIALLLLGFIVAVAGFVS